MGQTHAFAYAMAAKAFDLPFELMFDTIADIDQQGASLAANKYGFAKATGDWRDAVKNPAIDVASITTPNIRLGKARGVMFMENPSHWLIDGG